MDMKRHLKSALKQLGFDKPRKAQIIPMNMLDAEQDAIVIAATGSGKQVIYETVGLAHSDKLTIVIEPLLALIYNQVQTLQDHGVSADYIDMTRSKEDIDKILHRARKGKLTFLYVTPERLQNHAFIEAMQHSDIFMVVIDECHSITEWGYTFRDAYLHIGDFINELKLPLTEVSTTQTSSLLTMPTSAPGLTTASVKPSYFFSVTLAPIVSFFGAILK